MYNQKLEEKLFLLKKAEDFAEYYSKRIANDVKEDKKNTTLILIRDFTPIFILGFASYFDNVRLILTQNYDFEHDIFFQMKNTRRADVLASYVKALYYKAPKLKTLIRQGYKLQQSDLNFATKDFNMKRISIKMYTVGFDLDQYVTKLEGFPALVIDARIFENTVKEIKKNESNIVNFYTNLIINKDVGNVEGEIENDIEKMRQKIIEETKGTELVFKQLRINEHKKYLDKDFKSKNKMKSMKSGAREREENLNKNSRDGSRKNGKSRNEGGVIGDRVKSNNKIPPDMKINKSIILEDNFLNEIKTVLDTEY